MMITAKQKKDFYILWLLVVPLLFYIALNYFPAKSYNYVNMAIYLGNPYCDINDFNLI